MKAGRTTDVFVIGGGPAGLAAAIAARQKGFRVTLADGAARPIEKACGEGLMPEAVTALGELGARIDSTDGAKVRGICFSQAGARVSADFPRECGVGLRRVALHERMVERAEECGVELLWRTPVTGIRGDAVSAADGQVRAKWIVGADGQRSLVRGWSGIATTRLRWRHASRRHYRLKPWSEYVEVHWGTRAQAYVTPVGAEEVCVVMLSSSREGAEFESAIGEFPEIEARLARAELTSRERGAITSMHSLREVHRGKVALVGDASGSIDAITGEGIRLGLRQATALAEAMVAGDLRLYAAAHKRLMERPARMARLLLWLERHAGIRRRAICAMENRPELFARLLALHIGEGSTADFFSTGARLGWELLAT
jgi:flavin-dependent dehydrogenase